jgi:eukaryotic-like serine/threonine-protein kinase
MQDLTSSVAREQRLEQVLAHYLNEVDAGNTPNDAELLEQHPDLAADLYAFFRNRDAMQGIAIQAMCRFGDYQLLEEIARGGMGVVYKAKQVSLNRVVALKMILAGRLASATERARFRAEAEAAANLDHPHIVPIFQVGEHHGQPYFSMKLIEGGSLAARGEAPMPARAAAQVIRTVARAVHHAHQRGILHRDLKPSNILIDAEGLPYITDFGLARRVAGDNALTQSGGIVGTPCYMAPEQARSAKVLTTGVDVYSLGAMLYQLLTGRPPFRAATPLDTMLQVRERDPVAPRQIDPGVDRDLEVICLRCLEKDPQRRYDSAASLADELQRFLNDEPIQARPIGPAVRGARWLRRNPALATASAATVLALVAALVMLLVYAADRANAARNYAALNDELQAKSQRVQDAFRERNRQLAAMALERAQHEQRGGELGRAMLQLVEAAHFAQDAADAGLERSARTRLGILQAEVHRLHAVVPAPEYAGRRELDRVALGSGGATALIAGETGARLIDVATGRSLSPADLRYAGQATAAALSPDGTTAAVAECSINTGANGPALGAMKIWFWDAADGKPTGTPIKLGSAAPAPADGFAQVIHTLAFSPDARTVVAGNAVGAARRWDVASGKEIEPALVIPGAIVAIAYSPDGKTVAVSGTRQVRLWDATSAIPIGSGLVHSREVTSMAFAADSKMLVTGAIDGVVRIWDLVAGNAICQIATEDGPLTAVRLSADGRRLFTGSQAGVARTWQLETLQAFGGPLAHPLPIVSAAFAPNEPVVTTTTLDGTIRRWDLAAGPGIVRGERSWKPGGTVNAIGFQPHGDALLCAGKKGMVRWWDARTGAIAGPLLPHPSDVRAVAFSPDGRIAYTGCFTMQPREDGFVPKGEVYRWEAASGAPLGRLAELPTTVRSFTVTGNGAGLWVDAPQGCTLLDAADGKPKRVLAKPGDVRIDHAAVSPDGRRLIIGSHVTNVARLWDIETGQPLGPALPHADWVMSVAFSSDGTKIATGCKDKVARLWSAAAGTPMHAPMVHRLPVIAMAFSNDGTMLLTGSADDFCTTGEVCLWDIASGQLLVSPRRFATGVAAVAIRADGRAVASALTNGEVSVWPIAAPATVPTPHLRRWVQAWTGLELRDAVIYQVLPPSNWLSQKRTLDQFAAVQ